MRILIGFLFLSLPFVSLFSQESPEQMIMDYRNNPSQHWWMVRDIGIALHSKKRYEESIPYLRSTIKEFEHRNVDRHSWAWFYWYLGSALLYSGETDQVVPILEQGLKHRDKDNVHERIRSLLVEALIELGDRQLLRDDSNSAGILYRRAREYTSGSPSGIYPASEAGIRFYLAEHGRGPMTTSGQNLRGTILLCAGPGNPITDRFRSNSLRSAEIFKRFMAAVTKGELSLELHFSQLDCAINRSIERNGVTFPVLESATDYEVIESFLSSEFPRSDFIVISMPGYEGARNSASYPYGFRLGKKRMAKFRMDVLGADVLPWIHEFHHIVATVYWPVLGEAHRFQGKRFPARLQGCNAKDRGCQTGWPSFIRGASELDYYIGLYGTLHRYDSWRRMATVNSIGEAVTDLMIHE